MAKVGKVGGMQGGSHEARRCEILAEGPPDFCRVGLLQGRCV